MSRSQPLITIHPAFGLPIKIQSAKRARHLFADMAGTPMTGDLLLIITNSPKTRRSEWGYDVSLLIATALPLSPMRRMNVNALAIIRSHPAEPVAAAGKQDRMYRIGLNDCQFEIAIKWRGGYGVPIHRK